METLSAQQLEFAAHLLGPLLDEVVFLGGATVHLWLTEPGVPPVRATEDVDVVCEVASRPEYYRLGERLRERGLQEAVGEPVICRWRSSEPRLVLDVMPTDPDILGFSNPWYEEAIATASTIVLDSGATIRAATPVLLVATKLCAWTGRGRGDLLRSRDVHDVLTLVDGRPELVQEIAAAPQPIATYIKGELVKPPSRPVLRICRRGCHRVLWAGCRRARPPGAGPSRSASPLTSSADPPTKRDRRAVPFCGSEAGL